MIEAGEGGLAFDSSTRTTPISEHLPSVTSSVVALDNYVADDLYADRVLNPSGYKEEHTQYQPVDEAASDTHH